MANIVVLFDLDGTLTDPKEGIVRCMDYALAQLGYENPGEESLVNSIGPPLFSTFKELLRTNDSKLIQTAVATYRERYSSVGLFENRVYEGIPEALERLSSSGATLVVATSKPEAFARRIIHHFRLDSWFKEVYGSDLDGALSDKRDLLGHVLEREGVSPPNAVMVGDREHDIVGAKGNGMKSIGALWGYGGRAELEGAGADWLCETPSGVPPLVTAHFQRG